MVKALELQGLRTYQKPGMNNLDGCSRAYHCQYDDCLDPPRRSTVTVCLSHRSWPNPNKYGTVADGSLLTSIVMNLPNSRALEGYTWFAPNVGTIFNVRAAVNFRRL